MLFAVKIERRSRLDRGFAAQFSDSKFTVLDFTFYSSVELPIDSGIPDFLSCFPDSKTQLSGFYKQNFPGFRNPDSTGEHVGDNIIFA